MLGGAVGDALGAPVEFLSRSSIFRMFGKDGITGYDPADGGAGKFSDDTQMMLFTAEGLLRAYLRFITKGICHPPSVVSHAYLRWVRTQGVRTECNPQYGTEADGWLFNIPELHSQRAPGSTCVLALASMPSLGMPASNNSKGCGAVMRMAPVGLFKWNIHGEQDYRETFTLGCELAAITHGHPTSKLASGTLAVLVCALIDGLSLQDALAIAFPILRATPHHGELLDSLLQAESYACSNLTHDLAIERLGEGWTAEEALAIAVYCALSTQDFREGILLAVNHDGDSDSTGTIAGNLLGALRGVQAIPADWLQQLELRDVVGELAEDLHDYRRWKVSDHSLLTAAEEQTAEEIFRKYPPV